MAVRTMSYDRYLGDGVYASFDGWIVWLAINHHENKVVALEPEVMTALIDYWNDLRDCQASREEKK